MYVCVYTECPSTLTDGEELCQRLEQLQRILKTEPEEEDTEPVDIVAVEEVQSRRVKVKQEQEEAEDEPKFFLGLCPSSQFIRDTAEQVIIIQAVTQSVCSVVTASVCRRLHWTPLMI